MLDYGILRIIWWVLLGVLLTGFAVSDGFDLGAVMLAPFIGKTDLERRLIINSVGPVWEGNQVWLILGAGAIFAAWPIIYAVAFSGFYLAMLLALMGLILRPVSFKFRSKVDNRLWRSIWDALLFLSGLIPTLVFGVALGNVLQGVPFHFNSDVRMFYTGNFWALFNPFALLCGVTSVVMLLMHGAAFLNLKLAGSLQRRARRAQCFSALLLIILFICAGFLITFYIKGYMLSSHVDMAGPSNPLHKSVVLSVGAWANNYIIYPWFWLAPLCGVFGALLGLLLCRVPALSFPLSMISVAGVVATVGLSMFPFLLPSSSNPGMSLLVWDSSSSQLTLQIMLVATVIFVPIILLYTGWVYHVLRGKVTEKTIEQEYNAY